jgi:hypothetical protein
MDQVRKLSSLRQGGLCEIIRSVHKDLNMKMLPKSIYNRENLGENPRCFTIRKELRGWGCSSVVECLPSTFKAGPALDPI